MTGSLHAVKRYVALALRQETSAVWRFPLSKQEMERLKRKRGAYKNAS